MILEYQLELLWKLIVRDEQENIRMLEVWLIVDGQFSVV